MCVRAWGGVGLGSPGPIELIASRRLKIPPARHRSEAPNPREVEAKRGAAGGGSTPPSPARFKYIHIYGAN